jgi:hypothetical protein
VGSGVGVVDSVRGGVFGTAGVSRQYGFVSGTSGRGSAWEKLEKQRRHAAVGEQMV